MKNYKHFSEFPVDNQSGINKPSKVNNVKYKLNPQGSILNQNGNFVNNQTCPLQGLTLKINK